MTTEAMNFGRASSMTTEDQARHLLKQLPPHERRVVQRRLETHQDEVHLRQAMVEWLQLRDWDLFAHLTAREMRTEAVALRMLHRWQMKISRRCWGQNFWKRGEGVNGMAVIAHQSRGDLHIHAVIANTNELDPQLAKECWDRRYFHRADVDDTPALTVTRLAKIDLFRPGGGGVEYMTNHLGLGDDGGGVFVPFGSWLDG